MVPERVIAPNEFAATFDGAMLDPLRPALAAECENAPAHTIGCLEHGHIVSASQQLVRATQACKAAADHDDAALTHGLRGTSGSAAAEQGRASGRRKQLDGTSAFFK
jgi:hypothetical protein